MRAMPIDGQLEVTAAASLLDTSRLVEWASETGQFVPVPRDTFEFSFRRDVDPVFGRLICWIVFSAGAEFLAKGVCLINGVEIRSEQEVPAYPTGDIQSWIGPFVKNPWFDGKIKTTHFGTLGNLTRDDAKGNAAAFKRLCAKVGAADTDRDRLLAAYELLARTIRNRDAHAYVPNVRDAHFYLVPELFTQSFNLLVDWLPGGAPTLNKWRADAGAFVAQLP